MARLVVDANVVIALFDERDVLHPKAKDALRGARSDDLELPASAYAELLVGAFRAGADRSSEMDEALAAIPITIVPLTAEIARAAARLRASSASLRLADALALATATARGASLLTGDQRLARHRGVRLL